MSGDGDARVTGAMQEALESFHTTYESIDEDFETLNTQAESVIDSGWEGGHAETWENTWRNEAKPALDALSAALIEMEQVARKVGANVSLAAGDDESGWGAVAD